jgi:uncharacterized membrane protein YhaH (DUF805 family)
MKKAGFLFLIIAAALYVVAFITTFSNEHLAIILFPSAVVIAVLGSIILFIAVLVERLHDKKEEDKDDLSKY